MPALDRFANRYYYETHFMDDELPLWIWETGDSGPNKSYYYYLDIHTSGSMSVASTKVGTRIENAYSNSQFRPADWFMMESTPNYFIVDIYGISAGGYASHHKHRRRYKHFRHRNDHYNASGGSGACMYLMNAKIRIKDEDLKPITYQMFGKAGPQNPYGRRDDWHVNPANVHTNVEDWCMKLAEQARTPTGIAPAGHFIMGMAAGGNAYEASHRSYPGNGASNFYIPRQCAFPRNISSLRTYQNGQSYTVGEWINHGGTCYKVNTAFTATDWAVDSQVCTVAPTYADNVTFYAGSYVYYNGGLYYVQITFSNDPYNTILGFADYFLDKSIVTLDERRNGTNGVGPYKDSTAQASVPNRFFTESMITDLNEIWVRKSLSWGQGQQCQGAGTLGQGGGMAMIYKGESS